MVWAHRPCHCSIFTHILCSKAEKENAVILSFLCRCKAAACGFFLCLKNKKYNKNLLFELMLLLFVENVLYNCKPYIYMLFLFIEHLQHICDIMI